MSDKFVAHSWRSSLLTTIPIVSAFAVRQKQYRRTTPLKIWNTGKLSAKTLSIDPNGCIHVQTKQRGMTGCSHSDLLDECQNPVRDHVRTLDWREVTDVRQHRERGVRHRLPDLFRHRNRRCVILLSDDHAHWHPHRRLVVPKIGITKHLTGRAIAFDIIGKKYFHMRADHFRMRLQELFAHPARRLKGGHRPKSLAGGGRCALPPVLRRGRAIPCGAVDHRESLDPLGI